MVKFSHICPSFPRVFPRLCRYLPTFFRIFSDLVRILRVAAEGQDAARPRLHGRGGGRAVSLEDELAAVEVLEAVARYGKR